MYTALDVNNFTYTRLDTFTSRKIFLSLHEQGAWEYFFSEIARKGQADIADSGQLLQAIEELLKKRC